MSGQAADRMDVIKADITTLALDAIVNAANTSLLGGGGVDGAIHRKAGPELAIHCRNLHGCKVGDAKITPGFKLLARSIIHTVGPVWNGGALNEEALLTSCYRRSLEVAAAHGVATLAFPAISTGIFRFPPDLAAAIAVRTTFEFLSDDTSLEKVTFCCFDDLSEQRHVRALSEVVGHD